MSSDGAVGFGATVALVVVAALVALRPPMPRHTSPFNLQFAAGWLINEQPFLGLYWLAAGTVSTLALGDVDQRAVVARGRHGGRTRHRPRRARRAHQHRPARADGGAPARARRRVRAPPFAPPVAARALGPVHLVPPGRTTVAQPLRRRRARQPARRVRRAAPAARCADAAVPAQRWVPYGQQDARRPAPAVPAREPRLGVHRARTTGCLAGPRTAIA